MELMFIGADHEVTGSCHYLRVGEKNILVDYGMEQGSQAFENCELPVEPALIDYVFLTHAHVDHSGMLPLLYARGFRGQIYATVATCDLCSIMLRDCAHIQMQEAEWKNRKAKRTASNAVIEPLYTMEDADGAIKRLVPCEYEREVTVCDEVKIRFTDIGHLLGSSSIEVWATEDGVTRKIVFSGDIGNYDQPLIKDPKLTEDADYVVMESTYGDRNHDAPTDFAKALAEVMKMTFDKGGNVVIPAFSVGRTQEILYFIRRIKTEKLLPEYDSYDVYIDSPLSVEATNVFHENVSECFSQEARDLIAQGINPIRFPGLKVAVTSDESRMINFDEKPKVIISASGMCEAGRIRHHLKHNLWRRESTIVFVGFQVPGTLGHSLLNGVKTVRLFGEEIEVHADIVKLPGISGHADMSQLRTWITSFKRKPQKVFVVHGEEAVAEGFARMLNDEVGLSACAPYSGDIYDLITGERIREGSRQLVEKKIYTAGSKSNSVFDRLVAAGGRLVAVIRKCQGMANKDLAKFADQINSLCDKWDR